MQSGKTGLVVSAGTAVLAALFAGFLAGAHFVREDFTYLVITRYVMTGVFDVFTMDLCSGIWFRPLPIILWKICLAAFGLKAGYYYVVNAAILLATAFLAAALARRLGAGPLGSRFAGLLFVAHPVTVGAASYLAARFDVMGAFLAVCAIYLQIISRRSGRRTVIVVTAAVATLAACLCKEMYFTVPLLIFLLPADSNGEVTARFGFVNRLKESIPHLCAVCAYIIWRAAVIGHLIGGYIYLRSSTPEVLRMMPLNALRAIAESASMFAGVTYETINLGRLNYAVFAAALAVALWIFIGRRRFREPGVMLLSAWVLISVAPIFSLPDIIRYSPRLLYFPTLVTLIFLARLYPPEQRLRNRIAPLVLLMAWVPMSYAVINARRAESEKHRKLTVAMYDYYMPRALTEPENQYKIIFGVGPEIFTLDEMFITNLPTEMDFFNSPTGTFRFLFGDRINRTAVVKKPGVDYARRRYTNLWDYESHDRFLVVESERVAIETYRTPDILGLMERGKRVEVGVYDPETGTLADATSVFIQTLARRNNSITEPITWRLNTDIKNWSLSPQLQLTRQDSDYAEFISTGSDPYMTRSVKGLEPLPYRYVRIEMSVEKVGLFGPEIMRGTVSWRGSRKPPYGLAERVEFLVRADGKKRTYNIEVGKWPGWYLSDKLDSIRVDPVDADCLLKIHSISLASEKVSNSR